MAKVRHRRGWRNERSCRCGTCSMNATTGSPWNSGSSTFDHMVRETRWLGWTTMEGALSRQRGGKNHPSPLIVGITAFILICTACNGINAPLNLPGKIICHRIYSKYHCIYVNGIIQKDRIIEKDDGEIINTGYSWLNSKNVLLGGALYYSGTSRPDSRCDILEFDSVGMPLRVIYHAEDGEIAWPEFTSWNDGLLLMTTHHLKDPKKQPFEGLMPMLTLKVLDMNTGAILHTIDSIGRPPSYQMHESPWLHDGQRFFWSIANAPRLIAQGKDVFPHRPTGAGVYMYDMRLGRSSLFLPGARLPVVSAVGNFLAYIKDNELRVLDIDNDVDRLLFVFENSENVATIHWSPDGRFIFAGSVEGDGDPDEILIDVHSGKDMPVEGIGMTSGSYSWK